MSKNSIITSAFRPLHLIPKMITVVDTALLNVYDVLLKKSVFYHFVLVMEIYKDWVLEDCSKYHDSKLIFQSTSSSYYTSFSSWTIRDNSFRDSVPTDLLYSH
jgi:hypothetical protein